MLSSGKIINDPVLGFISLPYKSLQELLQHPWVLRLSRIKQLGLSMVVYPGNTHTRFIHSLGAMHLTNEAIGCLRGKGIDISEAEEEATLCAVLLHDMGHGPFSHALEGLLVKDISHEEITLLLMKIINQQMGGKLDLAISIFQDKYERHFLHQLISSQLDMDRLDYLVRDSFFSGVREGSIGAERLLKMLNVKDDRLVVDAKGLYSVENFLIARRLMYWQVYLHKTDVAAETMLRKVVTRAQELCLKGEKLFGAPALMRFIGKEVHAADFVHDREAIEDFCSIDDSDLTSALKEWARCHDTVLRLLSDGILNRRLFKVKISNDEATLKPQENQFLQQYKQLLHINDSEAGYLLHCGPITSRTYNVMEENILIMNKNGETQELSAVSDILNTNMLRQNTTKYYLCYYKTSQELNGAGKNA